MVGGRLQRAFLVRLFTAAKKWRKVSYQIAAAL